MSAENVIITGNPGANYTKVNNTVSTAPRKTFVYGRVVEVLSDRSIRYEMIQDNIGLSSVTNTKGKTGVARPQNPYSVRLPLINEIVPLVRAPKSSVSTLPNQYDLTFYYLDPIGVQNTVDDNQAPRLPVPRSQVKVSPIDLKLNEIGIVDNQPTILPPAPTPTPLSTIEPTLTPEPSPTPEPTPDPKGKLVAEYMGYKIYEKRRGPFRTLYTYDKKDNLFHTGDETGAAAQNIMVDIEKRYIDEAIYQKRLDNQTQAEKEGLNAEQFYAKYPDKRP